MSETGHEVFTRSGKPVIQGYEHLLPETFDWQVVLAMALFILGIVTILGVDRLSNRLSQKSIDPYAPQETF